MKTIQLVMLSVGLLMIVTRQAVAQGNVDTQGAAVNVPIFPITPHTHGTIYYLAEPHPVTPTVVLPEPITVPEPDILGLFALGALLLGWRFFKLRF
jgi:PEP-CTERM motif-containing protein